MLKEDHGLRGLQKVAHEGKKGFFEFKLEKILTSTFLQLELTAEVRH